MKRYYPSIQVFRAILFIFVLGFHCNVPFFNFGWGGVEAFFVISAFFMVKKQYGNDDIDIKWQLRRRIVRLYPPYIAVLAIVASLTVSMRKIPYDVLFDILSIQNLHWMITGYISPMVWGTAHTWTLSIEVLCGLVWLILLKYIPKKYFKSAMLITAIMAVVYRTVTIACGGNVYITSLCPIAHMDALAIGSLFAVATIERESLKRGRFWVFIVAGIAGISAVIMNISTANGIHILEAYKMLSSSTNYLNGVFTGNIYFFISLLTVGILGLLYISDNSSINCSNTRNCVTWLGDNSYILYLFHWPILAIAKKLLTDNWWLLILITFLVTLISTLTFNMIYKKVTIYFRRKQDDSIV